MVLANYNKALLVYRKEHNYEKWKKKLVIWLSLTRLEPKKQKPGMLMILNEDSKDAVLQLEQEEIVNNYKVENILKILGMLYLKDKI